jgi:shikimate dehydrogenase
MAISPKTKLTAIIGNPVEHSLSPTLHNAIYKEENIDAVMLAFGSPDIAGLVAAIRTLPIQLAAVTMPHKQSIMPLLDAIDDTAKDIGAVNTVVNREGKLAGYNTDVAGVAGALAGVELKGANVLLIGAGGAARTVAYFAVRAGANVFCHNRDLAQAEELRASFGVSIIGEDALAATPFDVIVNATPIGMSPNVDAMPVPDSIIRKDSAVFDLVYSPLETKLLKAARAQGARAISGLTMFLAQGLEQERLWLGRDVADHDYTALLKEKLQK